LGIDESSTSFSKDCKKLGPELEFGCWSLLGGDEGRGEGRLRIIDAVELLDASVETSGPRGRARLTGLPDGVASDSVGEAVGDFLFFFREGGVEESAAMASSYACHAINSSVLSPVAVCGC
jgi:hypothetical protein